MTPQQIATQAAEAIIDYQHSDDYAGGGPDGEVRDLAAIILAAAAKMVRESGAVGALEWAEKASPPQSGLRVSSHAALSNLRAITEQKP